MSQINSDWPSVCRIFRCAEPTQNPAWSTRLRRSASLLPTLCKSMTQPGEGNSGCGCAFMQWHVPQHLFAGKPPSLDGRVEFRVVVGSLVPSTMCTR